jgi:hypothetical protein
MSFMCHNGTWKANGQDVPVFPIQDTRGQAAVPLPVAEEAYKEYVAQYGHCQTLTRLAERGGFGAAEIAILLFERCQRLDTSNS